MRRARVRFRPCVGVILALLTTFAGTAFARIVFAQTGRTVVAVFPVVALSIDVTPSLRNALTAYVSTSIAETPGYRVIPSQALEDALAEVQRTTYSEGYDQRTRSEVGRKVAATVGAITQIIRIGDVCKVSIKLYDLSENISDVAHGAEGGCDEASLLNSIRAGLRSLKRQPAVTTEIKVGVQAWGGYVGGPYFNGGLQPSARSRFREYGIDVRFKRLDTIRESVRAWRSGEVDVMWITVDDLPTEYADIQAEQPVLFLQAAWSRGEEVLVARPGIKTLNDLRGRRIALEKNTTAHSFLLVSLDLAGLGFDEVRVVAASSNRDAANRFIRGGADAAIVWIDEDERCLRRVRGARRVATTEDASYLIAESLVVKESYLRRNRAAVRALAEGWLRANAEINDSPAARRAAVEVMVDAFGVSAHVAEEELKKVRLATRGDNLNFFGLSPDYLGEKGEDLYDYFWARYTALPGSSVPPKPSWSRLADGSVVREVTLNGAVHGPERAPDFQYCTQSDHQRPLSNKALSVTFPINGSKLSEAAKRQIDRQFGRLAEIYFHDCIRVDGNTDSRGSLAHNVGLSKRRAWAVKRYLTRRYGFDPRRIIAVGHGPRRPVATNATAAGRAKNRRTDFELLH